MSLEFLELRKKVQEVNNLPFIIKNVDGLDNINNEKCTEQFNDFFKNHYKEVIRLQEFKNLSSIGI